MSDISSVTGSDLADAELELLSITRIQGKPREWMAALRAAQREAVDAFIRDELPGLLAEAVFGEYEPEHGPYLIASQTPGAIAAKIAELRHG